jgi:hypothetical protein
MNIKKVKKNVNIDFAIYYNEETGESLASEMVSNENNIMVTIKEDTELVTLKTPENFAFINTDTILKIATLLNNADLGNLMKMLPLTKTEMNMLFNHSVPHSNKSLQKYLAIKSNKTFHDLIKRLMKVGVLYQIKGSINGAVRVVYIMNPHLSNRRKTFNHCLFDIFKDFKD